MILALMRQRQKYKKMPYADRRKNKTAQRQREIVPSRKLLRLRRRSKRSKKCGSQHGCLMKLLHTIRAGMSTAEIDKIVYDFYTAHGGIPAPLNYQGFPKSVCTSINNEVCHGIPMKTSSCRRVISSTSMYLPFWTAISLMHPVCS